MQEQHTIRSCWAVMAILVTCSVVALVVASSIAQETVTELQAKDDALQMKCNDLMSCSRQTDILAWELVEGRLSLMEASRRLRVHADGLGYNPLSQLAARYPALGEDSRIAVKLIHAVSAILCDQTDHADTAVARLRKEFEQHYRVTLPDIHAYSSGRH